MWLPDVTAAKLDWSVSNPKQNSHRDPNWPVVPTAKRLPIDQSIRWRRFYNTDVTLLRLFQNYPARTTNPTKADLFVVPFPYTSYCICRQDNIGLFQTMSSFDCPVLDAEIGQQIHLPHFTDHNANRHVWLMGGDITFIRDEEWKARVRRGVALSVGPADCKLQPPSIGVNPLCHSLVVPPITSRSHYQPSSIGTARWWVNDRITALAMTIDHDNINEFSSQVFLGKPPDKIQDKFVKILEIGPDQKIQTNAVANEIYQESVFCTFLPVTDTPVQRHFYDIIMNGCIPVLPVWHRSETVGYPGIHRKFGIPLASTLPYYRGLQFSGDKHAGLNYLADMTLSFNATCGIGCLVNEVDAAMQDEPRVTRLRENLRKFSSMFTYGLGKDAAYQTADAFAAVIVNLRHYMNRVGKDGMDPVS